MTGNVKRLIRDNICKYLLYRRLYKVSPEGFNMESYFIKNDEDEGGITWDNEMVNMFRMGYIDDLIIGGLRLTKKEKIEYKVLKQRSKL